MIGTISLSKNIILLSLPIITGLAWAIYLKNHLSKSNIIISILYYLALGYYIYVIFR